MTVAKATDLIHEPYEIEIYHLNLNLYRGSNGFRMIEILGLDKFQLAFKDFPYNKVVQDQCWFHHNDVGGCVCSFCRDVTSQLFSTI